MKRSGERGKGEFKAITWDEAIASLKTPLKDLSSALFSYASERERAH